MDALLFRPPIAEEEQDADQCDKEDGHDDHERPAREKVHDAVHDTCLSMSLGNKKDNLNSPPTSLLGQGFLHPTMPHASCRLAGARLVPRRLRSRHTARGEI